MIGTDIDKNAIKVIVTDVEYLDTVHHAHGHHNQLIYMVKGTLHIKLADIQYFLPEGHIAIIPVNMTHALQSKNTKIKMFILYFPAENNRLGFNMLNTNNFILENIRFISKQKNLIIENEDPQIYQFILAFLRLNTHLSSTISNPVKGLIFPKNERLIRVLQHMKDFHMEDLKLSSVANEFGFTERNLSRLFKRENLSFNNFLNYQRIIRAMELFSDNKRDIELIGYTVGYKTPSNFSRTFKKFTGYTPSDFLKNNETFKIYNR